MDVLDALCPRPSLNMFPTENRMSPRALAALSSDAAHRYPQSEGPDFFFGDVNGLARVYDRCTELAREYFGARHAFVPFLSGLHTMHTVLTALCAPGDRVLIMDPTRAGTTPPARSATGTASAATSYRWTGPPAPSTFPHWPSWSRAARRTWSTWTCRRRSGCPTCGPSGS